jgi:hypothetical protein
MNAQASGRFSEKKALARAALRNKLLTQGAWAFSTPREAEQKFFGSFFQKRTASCIELTCEIDIEQTWESFHAHAIPQDIDIHPGDTILVHDVPTDIAFGGNYTGTRSATLIRAGLFRRFMTRLSGFLELTELFEVGFDPIDKKG